MVEYNQGLVANRFWSRGAKSTGSKGAANSFRPAQDSGIEDDDHNVDGEIAAPKTVTSAKAC